MIWLILSAMLYAINNLLWKIFVRNEQPLHLISRRAIFTSLFALVILFSAHDNPFQYIRHPDFDTLLAGCLLGAFGLIFMVTFLKTGSLSLMGYYSLLGITITGSYTYLIKNEPLTAKILVGAIVLITGFFLYLWDERKKIKTDKIRLTQHLLLILMTIFFASSTIVKWEVIANFPTLVLLSVQEIVVLAFSFVALVFIPKKPVNKQFSARNYATYALLAVVILAAVFLGLLGLAETNSFISTLTTVMVPVTTVVFGFVFMKEKITKLQVASFLLIIIGELFLF